MAVKIQYTSRTQTIPIQISLFIKKDQRATVALNQYNTRVQIAKELDKGKIQGKNEQQTNYGIANKLI